MNLSILRRLPALCLTVLALGCAGISNFPEKPLSVETTADGPCRAYALQKAAQADYWQTLNSDGRVVALSFDLNGDGKPDLRTALDQLDLTQCRHLVIVLDGVPFELVDEAYRQGKFRLFHPPSRVYACFPSMTWLCFPLIFHTAPPLGVEAEYFDEREEKLTDASYVYRERLNEPWRPCVDYRCGMIVDGVCYVAPWRAFAHEMGAIRSRFERGEKRIFVGYNASSAGMGTAVGREGFRRVLEVMDRFCEEMMAKSRGKLAITMFADHGHSLTAAKRIPLRDFLRSRGYNVGERLQRKNDVVVPSFGLCTDAVVHTRDPERVVKDLLELNGVDLLVYRVGDTISVRSRTGLAHVEEKAGRYRYDAVQGDPLALLPILDRLRKAGKVDADGFAEDRALFVATALHKYPDPLYRIWLCWHGAVQNPPDIVVYLQDNWFWGRKSFALVATVHSTHGNLNYANTTTFAMTTAGPLPSLMRVTDLKPALATYFPLPEAP